MWRAPLKHPSPHPTYPVWAGGQGALVPASFVVEGPTLVRPIVWRHKLAHYMESSIDITASSGTHEAAIEGERRPEGPARVAQYPKMNLQLEAVPEWHDLKVDGLCKSHQRL